MRAVVPGAYGDAFQVEQGRQIMRVRAVDQKRNHRGFFRGGADDAQAIDRPQALVGIGQKRLFAAFDGRHADRFDTYCREYLNPFLNFHRPCLFATELPDAKKPGRIKRVYRPQDAMTPLDKLASLPDAAAFLREGVTLEELHQLARALTDVQAAQELNEARAALFRRVPARTG